MSYNVFMLIHVKIEPDSHKDEVIKKRDSSYVIKVKAPAHRNQANIRMMNVFSEYLKVPRNKLRLITGHHMAGKIVEVME
jgi:uncharacterized protein